jgi:lipopolysaccharide/colanic/teichoic acid biosynthesis glycosyltransferase
MARGAYSEGLEATRPAAGVTPPRASAPPPRPSRGALLIKYSFDKLAAAFAIVVIAPVFLTVALGLRLQSGRIFLREERLGENGRPVVVRSFALPLDTPAGRTLARVGIGALPQLWSLLKGEMSVVGPRPRDAGFEPPPARPGLTGLAQLAQLERWLSVAEQLELDDRYARTWSLGLDARIIGRTVRGVLR